MPDDAADQATTLGDMANAVVIPWQEVTPLPDIDGSLAPMLATVDSLRTAWEEALATASAEEFAEARRRSLRRHAIETGIIERLYDVGWGVTEALVAEGLTLEVAEREGGIDEDALATIQSQFDALEFLAGAARENRALSLVFISDLHKLITRHQATYEARNDLGQVLQLPLHHGDWKKSPNHVILSNGTTLHYAPPEQVAHQMEQLVRLFALSEGAHPLLRAAWLHHRFILIHPFEDGNGRVGRALVLLVLLEANYAPLVVDRTRRDEYLQALNVGNHGDLAPLSRLFAELEIVGLRSELERPIRGEEVAEGAVGVARAVAQRLASSKFIQDEERAARVAELADNLHLRLRGHLEVLSTDLADAFHQLDDDARATVMFDAPPDERAHFWRQQLIRTARALDFFTNLASGSWWVRLRVLVARQELRYVVALQKVGRGETGVLAVTCFAELVAATDEDEARAAPILLLEPTTTGSVTIVQSENTDARWPDVEAFVERSVAAALAAFGKHLG